LQNKFDTRYFLSHIIIISLQQHHSTRSSDPINLAHPPLSSSSSTNFIATQVLKQNFSAATCHALHYSCNVNAAVADSLHCNCNLYSSLKVNCSFHHASPYLWNELPKELRQPVDDESLMLS